MVYTTKKLLYSTRKTMKITKVSTKTKKKTNIIHKKPSSSLIKNLNHTNSLGLINTDNLIIKKSNFLHRKSIFS